MITSLIQLNTDLILRLNGLLLNKIFNKRRIFLYKNFIKPNILDLSRVGAHYAVSSLFEEYPETSQIYSYTAKNKFKQHEKNLNQSLVVGKALIKSNITFDESLISYAVLHLGDHSMTAGVREFTTDKVFNKM